MLQVIFLLAGLIGAIPNAFAAPGPIDRHSLNLMKVAAAGNPAINYTVDAPYDLQIRNRGAAVMTGDSITVYYIFYGNFSNLEIDRITNYAKHVSDSDTKPDRWSVAQRYYDSNGNYVTKPMKYGGYVHDISYSFGFNLSTTMASDDHADSDVGRIITSYIGNGKKFPYDPLAIYTFVSPPEVAIQDCPDPLYCYGGYHFSFNATIDNETKLINHAFCPALTPEFAVGTLDIAPNGDTGRQVVDFVVDVLHHEFFEAMSDAIQAAAQAFGFNATKGEGADCCKKNIGTETDAVHMLTICCATSSVIKLQIRNPPIPLNTLPPVLYNASNIVVFNSTGALIGDKAVNDVFTGFNSSKYLSRIHIDGVLNGTTGKPDPKRSVSANFTFQPWCYRNGGKGDSLPTCDKNGNVSTADLLPVNTVGYQFDLGNNGNNGDSEFGSLGAKAAAVVFLLGFIFIIASIIILWIRQRQRMRYNNDSSSREYSLTTFSSSNNTNNPPSRVDPSYQSAYEIYPTANDPALPVYVPDVRADTVAVAGGAGGADQSNVGLDGLPRYQVSEGGAAVAGAGGKTANTATGEKAGSVGAGGDASRGVQSSDFEVVELDPFLDGSGDGELLISKKEGGSGANGNAGSGSARK
ncbi:hypothetical protein HDU76_001212 [Blyttiomyces sp. JEL0837]|nr:hypothetical protein HDU76_001212 [Blyttiomyces sp. JEL0837]